MARPPIPASMKTTNLPKEEVDKLVQAEEKLKGNSDYLKVTPLDINEQARVYYEFIIKELEVSEILCNLDQPLVKELATVMSYLDESKRDIDNVGTVYTTMDNLGNHIIKKNPSVDVYNGMLTQFKTLCTQLGMSPSSRANLSNMQSEKIADDGDELKKVLRGEV